MSKRGLVVLAGQVGISFCVKVDVNFVLTKRTWRTSVSLIDGVCCLSKDFDREGINMVKSVHAE